MDKATKSELDRVIVVMGVSGCGKSTIAQQLATTLNISYYDADDFHPPQNIEKMTQGIPLTDNDRQSWLETLANEIHQWSYSGFAILACSALKEKYRKTLQSKSECTWVYLKIAEDDLRIRFEKRTNHFMPKDLIQSQFAILEPPEYGIHIDAHKSVNQIIVEILSSLD